MRCNLTWTAIIEVQHVVYFQIFCINCSRWKVKLNLKYNVCSMIAVKRQCELPFMEYESSLAVFCTARYGLWWQLNCIRTARDVASRVWRTPKWQFSHQPRLTWRIFQAAWRDMIKFSLDVALPLRRRGATWRRCHQYTGTMNFWVYCIQVKPFAIWKGTVLLCILLLQIVFYILFLNNSNIWVADDKHRLRSTRA